MVRLRDRAGLKQLGLGILMGIKQQQVSAMERGIAPIRAHWARLLNYIEREIDEGRKPIGWDDVVRMGGLMESDEKG